jgi:hypothetical protein
MLRHARGVSTLSVGVVWAKSSTVLLGPLGTSVLCGLWASVTRDGTSTKLSAVELMEFRCGRPGAALFIWSNRRNFSSI